MIRLWLALLAASEVVVVARVNDAEITLAELRERIAATRSAGGDPKPELLVEDLVNEALFEQEGRRLGLQKDPYVKAATEEEIRNAASALLVESLARSVRVDDDRLLELYHDSSDTVRLQMIVLATEAEAKACLQRLQKGGKLADEAKHSIDPESAAGGGELGTRSRGQLRPALAEAAFSAKVGTLTGPVKLDLGFVVIKVLERHVGDALDFVAKLEELRSFAQKQAAARLRSHFLEQLRAQAKVTVDEPFLKSTGTRLQGSPQEMEHVVATVKGRQVKFADVAAEVRRLFGGKEAGHSSGPSVKIEMAWSLVDRLLLADDAIKRGLADSPAVRTAGRRAERDAIVRLLSARLRAQAPKASEAEIEAYYRAHPTAFQRPARRPCAHILVAQREEADKLRARLVQGSAFADLARDFSRDSATATKGGAIGEVPEERLDALAKEEPALAAAFRGSPGAVSQPVKSRAGWHLVRCEGVIPAAALPLAEVSESIAARLSAQKADDEVRRRIAELRAGARIEVAQDAVRRSVDT